MFGSWLKLKLEGRNTKTQKRCTRGSCARPRLESLEDRLTPTVPPGPPEPPGPNPGTEPVVVGPVPNGNLWVTKTTDDGSEGTLRWAINESNTRAGTDTIKFQIGANGSQQTIQLVGTLGPPQG